MCRFIYKKSNSDMNILGESMNNIPKVIHYCWFGKAPLSELAMRCIASWKQYCPDYKIVEWNEENFDVNTNIYVKEAYDERGWAFVSDYVRLYVLFNYGGVYLDTDVELLKSLDSLLTNKGVLGFEAEKRIQTGVMASVIGNSIFKEFLDDYRNINFKKSDGSCDLTSNVARVTNICKKHGFLLNNTLQEVDDLILLPIEYLCPKNWETLEVNITENTLCIHHFDGSWLEDEKRFAINLKQKVKCITSCLLIYRMIDFVAAVRYRGVFIAIKKTFSWIEKKYKSGD